MVHDSATASIVAQSAHEIVCACVCRVTVAALPKGIELPSDSLRLGPAWNVGFASGIQVAVQ